MKSIVLLAFVGLVSGCACPGAYGVFGGTLPSSPYGKTTIEVEEGNNTVGGVEFGIKFKDQDVGGATAAQSSGPHVVAIRLREAGYQFIADNGGKPVKCSIEPGVTYEYSTPRNCSKTAEATLSSRRCGLNVTFEVKRIMHANKIQDLGPSLAVKMAEGEDSSLYFWILTEDWIELAVFEDTQKS